MTRRILTVGAAGFLALSLALVADSRPAFSTAIAPSPGLMTEPLFEGLGSLHHSVTTKSATAQRYFDQGLTFVYAFNHKAAIRSFAEAARLDPKLAMAWWGVALALGPNLELPMNLRNGRAAYKAIEKAQALAAGASPAERSYINALSTRYRKDGEQDPVLEWAYADAMRKLARAFPDDPDAATLFAESMMDLRPWNLWTHDGKPEPGTEEILRTLETVLKRYPNHLGANHYYIHAVEASPHPERALASARRLGGLTAVAGHLVHMPAYIFIRTGRYREAETSLERAIQAQRKYLGQRPRAGVHPLTHHPHNMHFLWYVRMMQGKSRAAEAAARELIRSVPLGLIRQAPLLEFFRSLPVFTKLRFAEWDEILAQPPPPSELSYTTGMWHYARGVAMTEKDLLDDARGEAQKLAGIIRSTPPGRIIGLSPARDLLTLASKILAGRIEATAGHGDEAVRDLRDAVRIEDHLTYAEPPQWFYPVRESLARELLAQGRVIEAERVYREDLRRNPANPWSLYGLARCLHRRGAAGAAARVEERFHRAWADADVKPDVAWPKSAMVSANPAR